MAVAGEGESVSYGERPLPQTVAAAGAMRRLTGLLLSLEHDHPTVDAMLEQMAAWEKDLAGAAAPDPTPRIGTIGRRDATRVPGPCLRHRCVQPVLSRIHLRAPRTPKRRPAASPSRWSTKARRDWCTAASSPFSSTPITQHQSCAARLTGKTRSLTVTFRRPTPILTELRFDIVRTQSDGKVTSTARLLRDDEVLCIGEFNTVASSPDKLTGFQFGKRRDKSQMTRAQRIRQPRVAEIVAARLREDILSGRIKEGDVLPSQESLFSEFGVSPPALARSDPHPGDRRADLGAPRECRWGSGPSAVGRAHRAHDQHGAADTVRDTGRRQRRAAASWNRSAPGCALRARTG